MISLCAGCIRWCLSWLVPLLHSTVPGGDCWFWSFVLKRSRPCRGNHRRKLHTTAVLLILCQYSWPKISVMDLEVMKRKWLIAEIAVCVSKVQNTRVCEPKHFEPRRLDFTRRCFPKCVRTRRYTITGEVYLLAIPFISLVVAQLAQ